MGSNAALLSLLFIWTWSLNIAKVTNVFGESGDYRAFTERERLAALDDVRKIFYFGYENYMRHAFPEDELNPIFCKGRGPDYEHPENININDVLGNYSLTLIDAMDTLLVFGNVSEFERAVQLVQQHVSFGVPTTIQVFEANIRVLGALLSSHLLVTSERWRQRAAMRNYGGELLELATDLASRLLGAFDRSPTGLPHPRINLAGGPPAECSTLTCTAAVGSLVLEFGVLSRLTGDPVYEMAASRVLNTLWTFRHARTGLFGNVIDVMSGEWRGRMSGLGAGIDSLYEYLLKSYVLFGRDDLKSKFESSLVSIKRFMRKGRPKCGDLQDWPPPLYVNVDMTSGDVANYWLDSLQAAWPAVLVLYGDVDEAVCQHALYYAVWQHYGVLPERFNWRSGQPEVNFYPLRPELVESTYFLYRATRNPFYLHVGRQIIDNLQSFTKAKCGYATVHDVLTMELEDRMESFFLSETCKYLYLLFDTANPVNAHFVDYVFNTEGHLFSISQIRQLSRLTDVRPVVAAHNLSMPASGKLRVSRSGFNHSAFVDRCQTMSVAQQMRSNLQQNLLFQYAHSLGLDS